MVIYSITCSELHKIQLTLTWIVREFVWLMSLAKMLLGWALRLIDWAAHWCTGTKSLYCCCWKYIFLMAVEWFQQQTELVFLEPCLSCFSATDWKAQPFCYWISMNQFLVQREACAMSWGLARWLAGVRKSETQPWQLWYIKNTQCWAVLLFGKEVQSESWVIVTELPAVPKRNEVLTCIILQYEFLKRTQYCPLWNQISEWYFTWMFVASLFTTITILKLSADGSLHTCTCTHTLMHTETLGILFRK